MNIIRKRNARTTATTIAKVACHPNGFDFDFERSFEELQQIAFAQPRSIRAIMDAADIDVWIEDSWKPHFGQVSDEAARCHEADLQSKAFAAPYRSPPAPSDASEGNEKLRAPGESHLPR